MGFTKRMTISNKSCKLKKIKKKLKTILTSVIF